MNFTRILGPNEKIYRKLADYCMSEVESACFVVCTSCQEQCHSEDAFWQHLRDVHNYDHPKPVQHMQTHSMTQQQEINCETTDDIPDNKRFKMEGDTGSPTFMEAEYLEQIGDLNDSDLLVKIPSYIREDTRSHADSKNSNRIKKCRSVFNEETCHPIDIDTIPSNALVNNGKLLKRFFLQLQRANIALNYKLKRLTQELKVLERNMRDECPNYRKKHMKIIPDSPLKSRDEVLILDGELHRSKEMRNNLHEEALMVVTESPDVYCRVLWRFIMTDEVSNQFCWRGVIDGDKVTKFPIKDTMIMDIFQAAFREKFPTLPLNTFKEKTITYFNKANERVKRSKIKSDEASDETYEEVYCLD